MCSGVYLSMRIRPPAVGRRAVHGAGTYRLDGEMCLFLTLHQAVQGFKTELITFVNNNAVPTYQPVFPSNVAKRSSILLFATKYLKFSTHVYNRVASRAGIWDRFFSRLAALRCSFQAAGKLTLILGGVNRNGLEAAPARRALALRSLGS